ncbi:MAG: sugar phosphate isomerase/epimerase [Acidobacteria bacterium]|nr:sugar phosphate isomerase/epimerase [Acidobacteriota bacterium]
MQHLTRRQFVQGAISAPLIMRSSSWAAAKTKRLPLAFSTLGCPAWDWRRILEEAAKQGYAALELRGIQAEMDLSKAAQFTGAKLKESLQDLAALDLIISDLGASANLHEPDAKKRANQMDEAKRFIDLAAQLKARYVRVFPNALVKGEEKAVTIARIVAGLRELGDHAKGSNVEVIVESHGEFTNAPLLSEIIVSAKHPNVAFLWDAHHTCVAGEKPETTWQALKKYVRHTHLKDSVAETGKLDAQGQPARRYVLTGKGSVPVRETVNVLVRGGYKGYYCLEWEKRWHPEIEDPEVAFPHYAQTMREYLTAAGVRAA